MSININSNMDYSALFNSLSTSSSSSSSSNSGLNLLSNINLSDYSNIKSGTYYKLMKAYYAKKAGESSDSASETDSSKTSGTANLTKTKNDAANVSSAASKLTATGSKSLFAEKDITTTDENGKKTTSKGYDMDAICSAVKSFTDSYNSLLSSAAGSDNKNTLRKTASMTNLTSVFQKSLNSVGVTIGKDNKLSVDETALKKANISTLKTVFNGANSFAANIGGYASSIGAYATSALNAGNTYSASGSYSSLAAGMNYNDYF